MNSEQLDWLEAAARATDPATSHAAAASVRSARLEALVLAYLGGVLGATTHEIAKGLGIELVTISPRMKPLVRKGFVVDSGELRKGASGRNSIVWRLK